MAKNPKNHYEPKKEKVPYGTPPAKAKVKEAVGTPPPPPPNFHWSFSRLDVGGPFCFSESEGSVIAVVLVKLGQFESMSLQDLRAAKCHTVEVSAFCKEAQDRLSELGQDDVDQMFSLRFSNTQRMYAIQTDKVMRIVWWDPEHKVYPVEKKHT